MRFRSYMTIIMVLTLVSSRVPVFAKDSSSKSSGLTVSISKVIVSQSKIFLQFIATNNTGGRVYLQDAPDDAQEAFLGSGPKLDGPRTVGIEMCGSASAAYCIEQTVGSDLSKYSYIEPSEFMSFSFEYRADSTVSDSDTISLSVVLIARFSAANGDPSQAGPMKVVRFNLPYVPLIHH